MELVMRRDPMFFVSGDLPRHALMRTSRTPDINPSFIKFGDLRVRVTVAGESFWLDEIDPIDAKFYPWGTVHQVTLPVSPPQTITLRGTLAGRHGMATEIELAEGGQDGDSKVTIELIFGGMAAHEPILTSAYIPVEPRDCENDRVTISQRRAAISSTIDISTPLHKTDPRQFMVEIEADPWGEASVIEETSGGLRSEKLQLRYDVVKPGSTGRIKFLAWERTKTAEEFTIGRFDEYVRTTEHESGELLERYGLKTPEPYIDAGFYAALLTLENTYLAPAWVEGAHKWNSYLVNNYQISAAIALGQLERARNALLMIGNCPGGPAPNIQADGSLFMTDNHKFEEGLQYFVLQLHRYWLATGDRTTLDLIWDATIENFDRMLQVRDPDGNGLINWHQGCNMFLYQADHLSLPGDAFSPSAMTAGNLRRLAEIAEWRGDSTRAGNYRKRADLIESELLRRLWVPEKGGFAAGVDTQGRLMEAKYYTDFVYPQLYSDLSALHAWSSLTAARNQLWLGEDLMRTGDYMPPLFGNNQVHPVQMAEAAEAFFRAGRADEGARLLRGIGRASSVMTDSPGSLPERISDSGFGQPDYGFGNPAGAYARGVVAGLFGLERTYGELPVKWSPVIPAEWEYAELRVDDIEMHVEGKHQDRRYKIHFRNGARGLDGIFPLMGRIVDRIEDGSGRKLDYELIVTPGGSFARTNVPAAQEHLIRVVTGEEHEKPAIPRNVKPGEQVEWTLPEAGFAVADIEGVFSEFHISGKTLKASLAQATGQHEFFLMNSRAILPVELEFPKQVQPERSIEIQGRREAVNLQPWLNGDSVSLHNFWGGGDHKVDLSGWTEQVEGRGIFRVGDYSFDVKTSGSTLIHLETGHLDLYEMRLMPRIDYPHKVNIKVGKKTKGIEVLAASEFKTRLTGMEVGRLLLHYVDGMVKTEPLVYGGKIDCYMKPFARETTTRELNWLAHPAAFRVITEAERELESIEIIIDAADGNVCILGLNVILDDGEGARQLSPLGS